MVTACRKSGKATFSRNCAPSLSKLLAALTAAPARKVCFRQSRKRPARPAEPVDTISVRGPAGPPTPAKGFPTPSRKPRDGKNNCGGTTFESKVVPPRPLRKPALDGSWVNLAKLNARSAKKKSNIENNSNVFAFGEGIAVSSLRTIFLLFHWHPIWCIPFASSRGGFREGAGGAF